MRKLLRFLTNLLIELVLSLGYAAFCAVGGISCLMMTAQPNSQGASPYSEIQTSILLWSPLIAILGLSVLILLDTFLKRNLFYKFAIIPIRIGSAVVLFWPIALLWMRIFGSFA